MDCVDLSNWFFLIRFYSKEDLNSVLKRGPWFVGDHFLSLRPWEPFFKLSSANVSLVAVWIRLYELPFELYEAEVLREIGESIGKVLKIDTHTAMEARGKVGHLKEACSYTIHKGTGMADTVDTVEATPVGKDESCVGHEASRTDPCNNFVSNTTSSTSGVEEDFDLYGPWMVVTRKKSGHKGKKHLPTTEGTTKPLWQPKHTLAKSSRGGPFLFQRNAESQARSGAPSITGKRAQDAPNLRPSPNQNVAPKGLFSSSAPSGSNPVSDRLNLVSDRALAHKKPFTSVRGKKVIAGNTYSSAFPSNAVSLPTQAFASKLSSLTTRATLSSAHGPKLLSGSNFKFMASTARLGDSIGRCVGEVDAHKEATQPEVEGCLEVCLAEIMVAPSGNHGFSALQQVCSNLETNSVTRATLNCPRVDVRNLGTWKGPDEGGNGDDRMEAEEGSSVAAPLC
nr:hypothetical protein CFP56_72230 [Quercus suber]